MGDEQELVRGEAEAEVLDPCVTRALQALSHDRRLECRSSVEAGGRSGGLLTCSDLGHSLYTDRCSVVRIFFVSATAG
jgi:hypothetical protein